MSCYHYTWHQKSFKNWVSSKEILNTFHVCFESTWIANHQNPFCLNSQKTPPSYTFTILWEELVARLLRPSSNPARDLILKCQAFHSDTWAYLNIPTELLTKVPAYARAAQKVCSISNHQIHPILVNSILVCPSLPTHIFACSYIMVHTQ